MDEFKESVMVALYPTSKEWTTLDLPHLTLVYAGEIPDIPYGIRKDLEKVSLQIAQSFGVQRLRVESTPVFGKKDKVDVLRFRASEDLLLMRELLERWNKSEYKTYQPHATVGPKGSLGEFPEVVVFDRVALVWGDDETVYEL